MNRALCAALALAAAGCAEGDPRTTNLEFVPEMVDAVPFESFSPNPVTRDHKTMLAPPKGSIPRGFRPFHYGAGPAEAARAGREIESPVPASPENVARGEKVYRTFCTPCHGAGGLGDGPVVPRFPAPPSLVAEHARALPDGQLYHVITRGQGLMPPHASQIQPDDRWKAVLYVRSLQQKQGGAK
jgi:mono/diheme cytochrome c family protein